MKRPNEIPKDAQPLVDTLKQLPEEQQKLIARPLHTLLSSLARRKGIINLVQEALGQLRVDMQYLMFDLEATRRERDDYRRQLEVK